MDYTRTLEQLEPKPDGEPPVRHRSAEVVVALNVDGTADILLSGVLLEGVSVLEGAIFSVGDTVQVLVWTGDLLVLGRARIPVE